MNKKKEKMVYWTTLIISLAIFVAYILVSDDVTNKITDGIEHPKEKDQQGRKKTQN